MARARADKLAPIWQDIPAGAKVLVDSAPIIYLLEDHPVFAVKFHGLFEAEAAGDIRIAISSLTIAEVLTGPHRHDEEALARRYEKALNEFEVIPVDAGIAASASRLRIRYGLKLPDATQLATALEIGAHALVTHDRDFAKVQGILIL
jgi:predicted nucleic acid-binding protein